MKKTIAAAVSVIAIAAAVPLVASAGSDGPGKYNERGKAHGKYERGGHHAMHRGDRHGGKRAEMRFRRMLETYDTDGDGAVTQDEIDAWRESRLREFDADGNGQLTVEEYEALWLDAMRERMVDRFQSHDDDGDGVVTVGEFAEPTEDVVLKRDRNEDGVLNLDDVRRGRGDRGPRARAGEQQGESEQQ